MKTLFLKIFILLGFMGFVMQVSAQVPITKPKIIRNSAVNSKPKHSSKSASKPKPTPKPKPTAPKPTHPPIQNSQPITVTNRNNDSSVSSRDRILQNLVNNMVYVQGGTFMMGATKEQKKYAWKKEKPAHQVTLNSFYIGRYEVTQEEWETVMGSNPSKFEGAKHPVEAVSWDDCQIFIRKLNQLTGKSFRMPTEAEWEYAARGGNRSNGYKYSGSDIIGSVAWVDYNSGGATEEVGQKHPNELGLYDMSGNVFEWCQDWYGDYGRSSQTNPRGPSSGSYRVGRGGGWGNGERYCRVSHRDYGMPDFRGSGSGLRLAFDVDK